MAAMQPTRLSGARAFMNKMIRERWDIGISFLEVDKDSRNEISRYLSKKLIGP